MTARKYDRKKNMFHFMLLMFLCTLVRQRECCQQLSDEIGLEEQEKWMNFSVNPCDNFFRFSCGRIAKSTEESDTVDPVQSKKNEIRYLIIENLSREDFDEDTDNINVIKAAKSLYKSCVHFDTKSNRTFNGFLKKFLGQSIGGWPVLQAKSWNHSSFDWKKTIFTADNIKSWKNLFMPYTLDTSDFDYRFRYGWNLLGLDASLLSKEPTTAKDVVNYLNRMVETAVGLGADVNSAKAELGQVLEFEHRLVAAFPYYQYQSTTYLLNTLQNTNSYALRDYIKHGFPSNLFDDLLDNKIKVTISSEFYSRVVSFVDGIDQRVVANYIGWKMIEKVSSSRKYLETNGEKMGRSERCLRTVDELLPAATPALYIRKYRSREDWQSIIGQARAMVGEIRREIIEIIDNIDWMEDGLRSDAANQLDGLDFTFGYPPALDNDTELNEWYRDLRVNSTNFFEVTTAISFFNEKFQLFRLKHDVAWLEYLPYVTHAHTIHQHEVDSGIQISVGALRGFTFGLKHPRYMNYANLGVMVGQALVRNIEPLFREVNPFTSVKTRACLGKYHRSFLTENTSDNVESYLLSLYTDVADYISLKAAYQAYKSGKVENEQKKRLVSLNYSEDQMFWISAAGRYCTKMASVVAKFPGNAEQSEIIRSNELGLLGPFSSTQQFSDDFQCHTPSRMNPAVKCIRF